MALSTLYNPDLFTVSKAFVKSTKAMKSGFCCSKHFSCSWLNENIMLISSSELSGSTLSAKLCERFMMTQANTFPTTLRRDIPL